MPPVAGRSSVVMRWWGSGVGVLRGRRLQKDEVRSLVWAATGLSGRALGDLPPREGLTWMIQWEGRTWPSSCGGVSTDLLVVQGERSWFVLQGRLPSLTPQGEPEKGPFYHPGPTATRELVANLVGEPEERELFSCERLFLIPFTNITIEYLNLLFIYAARGYPFRLVDTTARGVEELPLLTPQLEEDSFNFSLYELEQRVLSLLVVEQGFMMVNVAKTVQRFGLGWMGLQLAEGNPLQEMVLDYLTPGCLIHLYTVPYYPSMDEAIEAFLEDKWGTRKNLPALPYKHPEKVMAEIPYPSSGKIRRVKEFCRAVYENHGRFPAYLPAVKGSVVIVVG